MKSPLSKLFFPAVVLLFASSCSTLSKNSNEANIANDQVSCISLKGSAAQKNQLEHGIRGQVKFTGEPENLSSIIDKMSEYTIPTVSLAVIKLGEIAWADTYHNASFPEEQELDCTSVFQAASLSKPVTFLAALRMQAAGEIELDRDIQDYLKDYTLPPGKQTRENPVTLRNIFSHTSGITAGGYQGYVQDLPMPSDLDVLRGAAGVNSPAVEVLTTPNEALAYSGGAYTLAEVALQDKFGEEFSGIMRRWILEPAGMQYSDFTQPRTASKTEQVAKGYTSSGVVLEGGWRNHPEQAAAGLWSNATDMAKFLLEIYKAYQGKTSIFSASDIKAILDDERDGLVYGFILNRSGDDVAITHYGGNAGYRTGMTISLATGNGLVYLINSDNGGTLGNELLLSAAQVYKWAHFQQTSATPKQLSTQDLMPLVGEYKWNDQVDLSMRYDEEEKQLSLIFPNGDAYKLRPIVGEELDFIHPGSGVTVSFRKDEDFQAFTLYGQRAIRL